MFRPRQLSPLVLLLALGTAALSAQPASTEPAAAKAPAAPADATAPAPKSQQESAAPPAASPSRGREESPYDYHASEEISEDRPVSFPADI